MQLIYIHGLDSDAASEKGKMLKTWCARNKPEIHVRQPDLNMPPKEAISKLLGMIREDAVTGLVASSLGGFYAMICAEKTGCRATLLNPSTEPYRTMQRFFRKDDPPDTVGHTTPAGWAITRQQLDDLAGMNPVKYGYGSNLLVLLKVNDEVLDYRKAASYFNRPEYQAVVMIEKGGDHYYSDLPEKIPLIVQFLFPAS